MAIFGPGETPTDEPFKQFLAPMEVAGSIRSALGAIWLGASPDGRRPQALEQAARRTFETVEQWWLGLKYRTGASIVEATQDGFGPPASAADGLRAGTLDMKAMASWMPARSFAEALFWAWLLQPEDERTPQGTVQVVRRLLERELLAAAEDIVTFSASAQD